MQPLQRARAPDVASRSACPDVPKPVSAILSSRAGEALERILASPPFARSKRSAALLRYLVGRAVSGDTAGLKEYVIAVEVFGRDASFDPRLDSLVRVEATRLRGRLKSYYKATGTEDPVRIELPAGSYVPVIFLNPETAAGHSAPVVPAPAGIRTRRWVAAGASLLAVSVASFFFWTGPAPVVLFTNLRRVTLARGLYVYPALAQDARWVAYSTDRGSNHRLKLWRQDLEGGQATQLTFGDCDDLAPAISPDAEWIAFESTQDHKSIRLMPSRGGASRLVAYFGLGPRFSPDSKWLTYWVRSPVTSFGRVYIVPIDRPKEPVQIAPEFDDAHEPVWTPDGRHVLFCGTRRTAAGPEEEHNFWVAPIDGGPATNTHAFEWLSQRRIDPHVKPLPTTSFEFYEQALILTGESAGTPGLWRLPFSQRGWQATGVPERLTEETTAAIHPSVRGQMMAFANALHDIDIWSAPLDSKHARITGNLRRETTNATAALSPAVSAEGNVIAFLSGPSEGPALKMKDTVSSRETDFGRLTGFVNRLKLTTDGRIAYYRALEGDGGIKLQAIYAVDLESGRRRRVCRDCGAPTHVSPDGHLIIYETGSAITRLAAVRVDSGEKWEFLRHSHHPVKAGRVSPDGRWLAFQLDVGRDGSQLVVVPFRQATPALESEWIPVTTPEGFNREPIWSPDGHYLYYLSDRDGWRCVWASPFNPVAGQAGTPHEVLPLHEPRLTPLSSVRLSTHQVGLSVANNKIVLSLAETTASVWTGQLHH